MKVVMTKYDLDSLIRSRFSAIFEGDFSISITPEGIVICEDNSVEQPNILGRIIGGTDECPRH
jgi:hypothetical protein